MIRFTGLDSWIGWLGLAVAVGFVVAIVAILSGIGLYYSGRARRESGRTAMGAGGTIALITITLAYAGSLLIDTIPKESTLQAAGVLAALILIVAWPWISSLFRPRQPPPDP